MKEQKPLRVHIRVTKNGSPFAETLNGGSAEAQLETAWETVEAVRKAHPDAEISIEVDV